MTILQIISLIASLAGAAKDVQGVVDDLKAQGHPDDAPIPAEHAAKITAAMQSVSSQTSVWDETHAGE